MILKYIEGCVKFICKYYTTDTRDLSNYGFWYPRGRRGMLEPVAHRNCINFWGQLCKFLRGEINVFPPLFFIHYDSQMGNIIFSMLPHNMLTYWQV